MVAAEGRVEWERDWWKKPDGSLRDCQRNIARDAVGILMTDRVQWLDIFDAFMHRNYIHAHTHIIAMGLNLGMEKCLLCMHTFQKKLSATIFLQVFLSCRLYFGCGGNSWSIYKYIHIFYILSSHLLHNPIPRTRVLSVKFLANSSGLATH